MTSRLLISLLLMLSLQQSQASLVALESTRLLYSVQPASGTTTLLGTFVDGGTVGGLAYKPSTSTLYLSSTSLDSLFLLNTSTYVATLVGSYDDAAIVMHGLEYVPQTDTLYGYSSSNNGLYQINQSTGAASLIGLTALSSFGNLGWDSKNSVMYLTSGGTDSLYSLDLTTGSATFIGFLGGLSTNPNSLAYDPLADVLYMTDNSTDRFYSVNRATGQATDIGAMIGSTNTNFLGLAFIGVPEPSVALLMAVTAIPIFMRRRKNA